MQQITQEQFGRYIQQLIDKKHLNQELSYLLFRELMLDRQNSLQQGAFLAALVAKGETVDEIAGAWQAIDEFDTVHPDGLPEQLFENSGTGMDSFKTFNVSSAAAIVAAANGVPMARHGARAITSRCGTVDIMEAVGIDPDCSATKVAECICHTGIGLFNGMSPKIHPGGLGRILSQVRFGSTLNIAASLANPARPSQAVRGVHSERMVSPTASVMSRIGYQRGMVVHGIDTETGLGMDELSVCGPSTVCSFEGDKSERFCLLPEDIGIASWSGKHLAACNTKEEEVSRFIQVVSGNGKFPGCEDFVSLNAGAVLWTAGKVDNLKAGFNLALATLGNGLALKKLRQWVGCQSMEQNAGAVRFETLLKRVA